MAQNQIPAFKLNDGNEIPSFGFGVFKIPADGSTYQAVSTALKLGYRHIDTAEVYGNEAEVGKAVRDSGIPRDQIWITSKLWVQDYGYDDAKKVIDATLDRMGLDYLDLYLLHQPYGKVDEAWRALTEAQKAGKLHSIGISNFTPTLWNKWQDTFKDVTPAINQVEYHPYQQQHPLRKIMAEHHITLEAFSPLGQGKQGLLQDPVLVDIAKKYGKDVGQVVLRFEHQEGVIIFPKSVHESRIKSNQQIFDFELTSDEMDAIRGLDKEQGHWDPDNPETEKAILGTKIHD